MSVAEVMAVLSFATVRRTTVQRYYKIPIV